MEGKRNRAENMRLLHDTLIYTLTEKERRHFTLILTEFQTRRNRKNFVLSLRRFLNTAKKQEVVPYLIAILPNREREHFLNLWMKTSEYNMFYNLDENKNCKRIRQQNLSFSNSYPIHQRQEQLHRKRELQYTPQLRNSNKRPHSASKPLSALSNNHLSASLPSLRSASQLNKQPKTHVISMKRGSKSSGFGFSIRGGAEHGLGIYVSSVEDGSIAEQKNLTCGDQIIKLNEHNFQKINHSNAVKIIQQSKKLRLLVFSSSIVPGARLSHVDYQWVDTNGRPSSPPSNFRKGNGELARSRSIGDIRLLQDDEERRVIVHVHSGTRLGLKIRGGIEYGVGIYVSAVDRNHVAETSGIRAGDQILDVNGMDFQEITHKDAIRVLKSYKMMSMLLRHVGKMPYARTMFEKTEWLESARTSRSSSVISIAQDGRASPSPEKSKFRQGIAGSQLLHQSAVVVPAHRRIEEQARSMLSDKELAMLKYFISEYIQGSIHVEGLVISLFHLFDSSAKISLINDVRSVIFPQEVDTFDRLVLEKEIEAMKNLNKKSKRSEQLSNGSHLSSSRLSPKVPAKALSYKQLKSPRRQSNSKVPWSPPSTPLPSIPDIIYDEPLLKQEPAQLSQQASVIDDLDFEDEEGFSADDLEDEQHAREFSLEPRVIKQNEHYDMTSLQEESLRRIIEDGMRKLDTDSHNEKSRHNGSVEVSDRGVASSSFEVSSNDVVSQERAASPLKFSDAPSSSRRGQYDAEDDDDDDVGFSLMRSALLGFGNSNDQDNDRIGELEENSPKQIEQDLPSMSETRRNPNTMHEVESNSVVYDAKQESFGAQLSRFRPRYNPDEELEVIRETAVNSAPMSPSNASLNLKFDGGLSSSSSFQHTESNYEAIGADGPSVNSPLSTSSLTHENKEVVKRNEGDESIKTDIVDLRILVERTRIGESEKNLDNSFDDVSDKNTLEDLQQFSDLEFEYEDEPELAEPSIEDINEDLSHLKFAPIKLQETAPSSPYLELKPDKQEMANGSGQGQRARVANVYESDLSSAKPFGFPGSSGSNRRQRFEVEDIASDTVSTSRGFQSFSPRILNSLRVNEDCERNNQSVSETNSRLNRKELQDAVSGERFSPDNTGQRNSESVLILPDRSLTNKRIPIISYRASSPEKGFRDGDSIVREIDEMTANRMKHADEENHDKATFHSLRSIFEHQRLESPRTEYLSEIIKKNNTEGRKRFKSSDSMDETMKEALHNGNVGIEVEHRLHDKNHNKVNTTAHHSNVTESDLSSTDDFDFSSIRTKSKINWSLNSLPSDEKLENSSGYGSEDYSPVASSQQKTVKMEKLREELGLVLEASKRQKRGVQIKNILAGELYAACMYPQLEVGQDIISVDGEPLQGLGVQLATISMTRAYNNPSGRFLEIVVKNQRLPSKS